MSNLESMPDWWIFQGTGEKHNRIKNLPDAPPWRRKSNKNNYIAEKKEIDVINAALYLRRPVLVTGKPGTGKSSLAKAVSNELGLDHFFSWSITTQTTLREGLYQYDAIGRLQENKERSKDNIDKYLSLGPLGSAFATSTNQKPAVLLIDEIDKSDIDLPNNLLHIFEEAEFEIPELERHSKAASGHAIRLHNSKHTVKIKQGKVECKEYPLVIMTSNSERVFPPAFLRRCLQLDLTPPSADKLSQIVKAHIEDSDALDNIALDELINSFIRARETNQLATDQLLNTIHLLLQKVNISSSLADDDALRNILWESLNKDF